jgi:hypothetical protein
MQNKILDLYLILRTNFFNTTRMVAINQTNIKFENEVPSVIEMTLGSVKEINANLRQTTNYSLKYQLLKRIF